MSYQLVVANKNYSTWPLRAWVALKEAGIPFEELIAPKDDLSPVSLREEYLKISPIKKFPLLLVHTPKQDKPLMVWDSLAIIEYLAESYKNIWPTHPEARAFARSASAEMHSGFMGLRTTCNSCVGLRIKLHNIDEECKKDFRRLNELVTEGLERFHGPFMAGATFTAVDAMYCPVAFRVQTYNLKFENEAVNEYFARLLNLSSMKEWEAAALKEPWRMLDYEQTIVQYGTVVEDLRTA
ncbi:hypothetical protein THRCLA_11139 [Thraustotheca clavata]|uniref:GST N-terminal domain-containing protein n=1 Tax=Thraustotheca clavata TaxID=74557 RepID=A0A1V9Y8R0_9STRA|nr:hypothetical protein THRCLA_11139 [Thraustotheca clavata]